MLSNIGFTELSMILAICVVLFGAKRIPEIGSSIGKGIREFKRGVSDINEPVTPPAEAAVSAREAGAEPQRLL